MGGALEARNIPAGSDRLWSEARGEIEAEGGVLVVKRIHVSYRLTVRTGQREAAERAHRFHRDNCPTARTIGGCVQITTSLDIEEGR